MSDHELSALLDGKQSDPRPQKIKPPMDATFDDLIANLRKMESIQDGKQSLMHSASTRKELVAIARQLDLPVSKRDTVEQLADRIIDATIGFRMRSAAIRGNKSTA